MTPEWEGYAALGQIDDEDVARRVKIGMDELWDDREKLRTQITRLQRANTEEVERRRTTENELKKYKPIVEACVYLVDSSGCCTGDCPHDYANECIIGLTKYMEEIQGWARAASDDDININVDTQRDRP